MTRFPRLTPSEMLEELTNEVLASMDQVAFSGFSDALDGMMEFHIFLLRSYAVSDRNNSQASYAQDIDQRYISLHSSWLRQYRRIFERASNLLEEEPKFFQKSATIPTHLISHTVDVVSDEMLDSMINLGFVLFYFGGQWWGQNSVARKGRSLHTEEAFSISGYRANIYDRALREFVGAWERFESLPGTIWNWDQSSLSDDDKWKRMAASTNVIRKYFRCTAYMVAEAVWRGDALAASIASESLSKPAKFLNNERDKDFWLRINFLDPDILEKPWTEAQKIVQSGVPMSDYCFRPESIFQAWLENFWVDVTLTLLEIITSWGVSIKGDNNIISQVLSDNFSPKDKQNSQKKFGIFNYEKPFEGVICSLIRRHAVSFGTKYGSWLNDFISETDALSGPEIIPGRLYSLETKQDVSNLTESQFAIILSLYPRIYSSNISTLLNRQIETFVQSLETMEPISSVESVIEGFRETVYQEVIPKCLETVESEFGGISAKNDRLERRKSLNEIFGILLVLLENAKISRINSFEVDEKILSKISYEIGSIVFSQYSRRFPFSQFQIKFDEGGRGGVEICKQKNFDKGRITKPNLMSLLDDQESQFSLLVFRKLGTKLLHEVLSSKKIFNKTISSQNEFWMTVHCQCKYLTEEKLNPLVLIGNRLHFDWIDHWITDENFQPNISRPETVTMAFDFKEKLEGYVAKFDNTEIYRISDEFQGSFVVPKESFGHLKIFKQKNRQCIDLKFYQYENSVRGDLSFFVSYSLSNSCKYELLKLISCNEEALKK